MIGELIDDFVVSFELLHGGGGILEVVVGRGDQSGDDENSAEQLEEPHVDLIDKKNQI